MLESKSSALTDLAIPLLNRLFVVVLPTNEFCITTA